MLELTAGTVPFMVKRCNPGNVNPDKLCINRIYLSIFRWPLNFILTQCDSRPFAIIFISECAGNLYT